MKKTLLIMVAMLLSFQFASAQKTLFVKGVDVLTAAPDDVLGDGGSVKYNSDTETLTLTNASITTSTGAGISTSMSITVQLVGTNTISVSGEDPWNPGFYNLGISTWGGSSHDYLTIQGNGTLDVSSVDAVGLLTTDRFALTIKDGCKVTASSANSYAISATGGITVDNATLIAKGNGTKATIVDCIDLTMENGVDIRSNHEYNEGKFYVKGTTTEAKDDITIGVAGTGIEEVHNAQCTMHDVRKVLRNGQLLIIREGEVFNAQGVKL